MATLETQILDNVVVNTRRKMLTLGGAALAGLFMGGAETAKAATLNDTDVLNFALNLEYLEANFYYLAAFGITIDATPNAASMAAYSAATGGGTAQKISIAPNGGTAGTVSHSGVTAVPWNPATDIAIAAYANETAIEEGKHVVFLQSALGGGAVAQPMINLDTVWPILATAAGIPGGGAFSPYTNSTNFLLGAYVFEDVGVTAYHGAAPLLTDKGHLAAAAGILSVEAYHAGLIRTSIFNLDPTSAGAGSYAGLISTFRAARAKDALLGVANKSVTLDPDPDDFGTATFPVTLAGMTATGARIVDADTTDAINPIPLAIAFARNTSQVLNIVTGGGAVKNAGTSTASAITPAIGGFFPAGLNGNIK